MLSPPESNRLKFTTLLISMACCGASCMHVSGAGIDELTVVQSWQQLAHGVWSAEIGDLEDEIRYSDLAAAPPKIKQLNQLPDIPLAANLQAIRYRLSPDGKVVVHIPTGREEKLFGFGLQFDNTLKSGQVLDLKVDHFSKGGGATHAPVPFYISSQGYGVFFNTARYLKVYAQVGNRKDSANNPEEVDRNPPADEPQAGPWLAVPPGDAVEATLNGKGLELVVFTGENLLDVVARYNLFSGGGAMPPLWGLGFWHRVPSKFSAAQTEQEIADFKQHHIPLDVIGLEPGWQTKSYPCTYQWQKKRFPDPAGFTRKLLEDGIRLNLWENPYISKHASIYQEMLPLSGSHLVWLGIVPDYTLPQARRILTDQHKKEHIDIGVSGYKIDEVDGYDFWLWPDHATFPSGVSGEAMRQTYGLRFQKMLYQELFHQHNQRTYSLVRASNGASSAYPFAIYSDSYGHGEYITGLSSASLCGILWCPEIRSAGDGREWINRMHTVCFSPLAMLNAWASATKPWSYPESTDAVRRTIQLRMRLLPYLYTAFAQYHQQGIPPIRSMLLEGGQKTRALAEDRQVDSESDPDADGFHRGISEDNSLYMFGPDILVAPFYNSDTSRQVKFPEGNWYDFHTGQFAGNDETLTVTAAGTDDLPPLFVREGALIPLLLHPVDSTAQIAGADLELRLYGEKSGACTLYEDDGETYNFEQGVYNLRRFTADKQPDGSFLLTEAATERGAPSFYGAVTFCQMSPALELE